MYLLLYLFQIAHNLQQKFDRMDSEKNRLTTKMVFTSCKFISKSYIKKCIVTIAIS